MSKLYSIASKKRWKNVPPEERSARGKTLANIRWSKTDEKTRKMYSLKMVEAKKKKRLDRQTR